MLTVVVHYADSSSPAMTKTDSELLGDADLPELASRLARLLPAAKRVQIFDDDRPVADTDAAGPAYLPARIPTAIPPPETEVFDINRVDLAALRRVVDRLQVMD